MDTSAAIVVQREYPSSAFLGETAVVVTDGNGLLYVLPIRNGDKSEPIGIFTLHTEGAIDAPFRLHHIHRASPTTAILLLSSRFYSPNERKKSIGRNDLSSAEFDIWATKIDLLSLRSGNELRDLDVLWHRRGQDVPIYTKFIQEVNSFLIVGGSTYPDPNISLTKPYEPTPDEMAPIPRANENLDTSAVPKPFPYSWTQSSDSITIAFPLPSSTPKSKIRVLFTTQTLTLHIDAYPLESAGDSPLVSIPHFSAKALWDSVNTTSCFWTWDREAEHAYGLLTLHMEKKNEGTRWMQVFAAPATATAAMAEDTGDVEVPETLDPSELWHIRESLEKYTAALRSGEDASGLGLGRGVPSLVEGEVDEEADASVGRKAWATWVDVEGGTPAWSQKQHGAGATTAWEEEDESVTLLSTPIPGGPNSAPELILKQDIDGTVFSLDPSNNPNANSVWRHISTYPALAFVLASKQDTRFTYHLPGKAVFAFEGGSIRDRGANVYIYRLPTRAKDIWAKQSVLQVDDGSGGALLGVGCVKVRGGNEGEVVVVCLTEYELVLIAGI